MMKNDYAGYAETMSPRRGAPETVRGNWVQAKTTGVAALGFGKEPKFSPYYVDVYGRPRIISRGEVMPYRLARLVLVGIVLGFALAILVVAHFHSTSVQLQETAAGLPANQ